MRRREIDKYKGNQILRILVEECGYKVLDPRDGEAFIHSIAKDSTTEYRFCGALGFGGKFRNNGNGDNTPYVDCYREDETPARLQMIQKANERLHDLFAHS